MIEFMQHLRKGDPVAKEIHLEYGGNRKAFTEQARMYLVRLQSPMLPSPVPVYTRATESKRENDMSKEESPSSIPSSQRQQTQPTPHMSPIGKITRSANEDSSPASPFGNRMGLSQSNTSSSPPPSQPPYSNGPNHSQNVGSVATTPLEDMSHDADMEQMVANLTIVDDEEEGEEELTKNVTATPKAPPGLGTTITVNQSTIQGEIRSEKSSKTPLTPNMIATNVPEDIETSTTEGTNVNPTSAAPKWQPKRLWTRLKEQPGTILANQIAPNKTTAQNTNPPPRLHLGPRMELTATWSLPLGYLRERTLAKVKALQEAKKESKLDGKNDAGLNYQQSVQNVDPEKLTVRDALRSLTVGLFRRGCAENGSSSAIIAKEVVPAHTNGGTDGRNQNVANGNSGAGGFHFEIDHQRGLIWGNVPFYTPRTPGNVILRLYFEDDPLFTLATSASIRVVVREIDLEPTLRFILSNFKGKKGSTNFSSIHSLAAVLDQYQKSDNGLIGDGAGRAAWGCICESKKIVEASKQEYIKKKEKSLKAENELNKVKDDNLGRWKGERERIESEEKTSENDELSCEENSGMMLESRWREKMNVVMGERASFERKWREVQSSFASVLKAVVMNNDASSLLKRELVTKLKCEYSLWCSLCECFAENPFELNIAIDNDSRTTYSRYPYPMTVKHIEMCKEKCRAMQVEMLGFVPQLCKLSQVQVNDQSNELSKLSASMEKYYEEKYNAPSMTSANVKNLAREMTEDTVSLCESFPKGTRVVVFGSSANGFGYVKSLM